VAGGALDGEGLPGVADGPVGLALIEVDAGERGEGLAFEQPP
jgi:hypothetical protein